MANGVTTPTILEEILAHKQKEVAAMKSVVSLIELEGKLPDTDETRGFTKAIRNRILEKKPAIIAEIKKASPSKGLIRGNFRPAAHAED